MVSLKGVTVRLQVLKGGHWMTCEEFESTQSVKDNFSSASKLSTGVECMPGQFRFLLILSEHFVWEPEANAVTIDLTFDEGDPLQQYQVVALKQADTALAEKLGIRAMDDGCDGMSFCVEKIAMPVELEDSTSLWFETGFQFERYSQGPTKVKATTPRSTYKGKLKIDIRPCVAKRDPHQNARITLDARLPVKWRRCPPRDEVTLKPALKPDTTRECGDARRYLCTSIKGAECVSFLFHYREQGFYERVDEGDVDVITDDRKPFQEDALASKSEASERTSNRQKFTQAVGSQDSYASEIVDHNVISLRQQFQHPRSAASSAPAVFIAPRVDNNERHERMGGQGIDTDDFIASAVEIVGMRRLMEKSRRERLRAEQMVVREEREKIRPEIDAAQLRLDTLRLEDSELRDKDQRLERHLRGEVQEGFENEFERDFRKKDTAVEEAFESLLDCGRKILKRRRTSSSTG